MADPASLQPVVQQQQSKDALLDVRRKLESISAEHKTFGTALTQSLDVVRRALEEFGVVAPGGRGGGGSLAISFNGGKDACVVLYLLLLVLAERDELDRLWATAGDNVSFSTEASDTLCVVSHVYRTSCMVPATPLQAGKS